MWHKFSGVGVGVDQLSVTPQWFVRLHQFVPDENISHYVSDRFKTKSTISFYFPSLNLTARSKLQENTYKATANSITATQFPGWWFPWVQGQCQERGRSQQSWAAGTLQGWAQHPPHHHQHQPSATRARLPCSDSHHAPCLRQGAFFKEEGERRRVKNKGILHCETVGHKAHKIALKTQGRNTNKKHPPLKASNTPSFNLSVFPLQFLIWKEK